MGVQSNPGQMAFTLTEYGAIWRAWAWVQFITAALDVLYWGCTVTPCRAAIEAMLITLP